MAAHSYVRLLGLMAASCLLAAALGYARGEEPPLTLKTTYAKGDLAGVEELIGSDATIEITAPGKPPLSMDFNEQQEQHYRMEVLAAANGRPTAVKYTWSLFRTVISLPSGQTVTKMDPLHGKTVTVKKTGNKVQVATSARLPADEIAQLKESLRMAEDALLPGRAVREGETWKLRNLRPAPSINLRSISATGRLAEVTQYDGEDAARLELNANLVYSVRESPAPLRMTLSGDIYYSLPLQRLIKIDMGGPLDTTARFTRNGLTATMRASGNASLSITNRWLKIAGKPVPHD